MLQCHTNGKISLLRADFGCPLCHAKYAVTRAQPLPALSLYARNAIRNLCQEKTANGCFTTAQMPDLPNTVRSTRAAGSGVRMA
jgi:hypothetical protein